MIKAFDKIFSTDSLYFDLHNAFDFVLHHELLKYMDIGNNRRTLEVIQGMHKDKILYVHYQGLVSIFFNHFECASGQSSVLFLAYIGDTLTSVSFLLVYLHTNNMLIKDIDVCC